MRGGGGEKGDCAISRKKNSAQQKSLKEKCCKGNHAEKVEQNFPTIHVLFSDVKKILHKL